MFIHIGLADCFGANFEFQYFGGFLKKNDFWGMKIFFIFSGVIFMY